MILKNQLFRKADCEQWEDYHEPLARIFKEVKKALPHWRKEGIKAELKNSKLDDYVISALMIADLEVIPEIEKLLTQMITEIEDEA